MCLSSSTPLRALLADVSTRFGKKRPARMTGRRWFSPILKETKTRVLSTLTRSPTRPPSRCSTRYSTSKFPSPQDMSTPIKFNGRQYKESLLFFVKVLLSFCSLTPATIRRPEPGLSCCAHHRCSRSSSRFVFSPFSLLVLLLARHRRQPPRALAQRLLPHRSFHGFSVL